MDWHTTECSGSQSIETLEKELDTQTVIFASSKPMKIKTQDVTFQLTF